MQIKPEQLEAHCKKKLLPAYLISGDEPLQIMESVQQIRTQAKAAGYSGREILFVDADFNWSRFQVACQTLSLIADKRLVELRMPHAKPGREGGAIIKQYLESPSPDIVLLITCAKLEKASQNSQWFRALDQVGGTIAVYPVSAKDMASWVLKRLRGAGLEVDLSVAELIAQRTEGSMLGAQQEIDKLAMSYPNQRIDQRQVLDDTFSQARYQVYDLADAVLLPDVPRVIAILDYLALEGVSPIPALVTLTYRIRSICVLAHALAQGDSEERALQRAGIWRAQRAMARRAVKRRSAAQWELLLLRATELELVCKGMSKAGNPWDEILSLSLSIAEHPLW